jgi:hypothetical protein
MTLYCSRQPKRHGGKIKGGWVLYSISSDEGEGLPHE